MSKQQRAVDELDALEQAYGGPAAPDDSGDRDGHHQWKHSWPPGSDGYECRHCGLVVSMTEFPLHRDGFCADWPVLDEEAHERD